MANMHPLLDAFWQGRTKFKKKSIGTYFEKEKNPRAACHVGAIYWGLFKKTNIGPIWVTLSNEYPEITSNMVPIPCEHAEDHIDPNGFIASILIHLNDEHDGHTWPDSRVAKWLEDTLANPGLQPLPSTI